MSDKTTTHGPVKADPDLERARIDARIAKLEVKIHDLGLLRLYTSTVIDGAIAEHREQIRELRAERNLYAVTSRLPPEILARIFLYGKEQVSNVDSAAPEWYKITHVSRLWRDVAIDYAKLWTNIYLTPSAWTTIMLERSKHAPLSLDIKERRLSSSTGDHVHDLLATQAFRFRSVTLTGSSDSIVTWLKHFGQSAPTLQLLVVVNDSYNSEGVPAFPPSFLIGGSQLRTLVMKGCHLLWTLPCLKGLTTLELSTPRGRPLFLAPLAEIFLQALENMPQITSLALDIDLPDMSGVSPHRPPVSLPFLEILRLQDTIHTIPGVLNQLRFPASASLYCKLPAHGLSRNPAAMKILGDALMSALFSSGPISEPPSGATRAIQSLQVSSSDGFDFTLQVWPQSHPFMNMQAYKKPRLSLMLTHSHDSADPLLQIVPHLPLKQLKTLDLEYIVESRMAFQVFDQIPSQPIANVYVHDSDSLDSLCGFLYNPVLDTTPALVGAVIPFPNLEFLSITADFTLCAYSTNSVFFRMLALRQRYEKELRHLKLHHSAGLNRSVVDQWRKVVTFVDWDGKEVGGRGDWWDNNEDSDSDEEYVAARDNKSSEVYQQSEVGEYLEDSDSEFAWTLGMYEINEVRDEDSDDDQQSEVGEYLEDSDSEVVWTSGIYDINEVRADEGNDIYQQSEVGESLEDSDSEVVWTSGIYEINEVRADEDNDVYQQSEVGESLEDSGSEVVWTSGIYEINEVRADEENDVYQQSDVAWTSETYEVNEVPGANEDSGAYQQSEVCQDIEVWEAYEHNEVYEDNGGSDYDYAYDSYDGHDEDGGASTDYDDYD
ncbi:hypothetical protein FA15DRAFT_757990 [Coprinopsis marcescibilis]|uniref:F-box domain-containing protein n=1 Tax=Coprinopsis marcescibilis TaxID=230819 RepID=A0A5C3KQH6_COPMA|nr:hypothetical protein FA15DRAFT_757990 [Coprinopsis marcescibilis]